MILRHRARCEGNCFHKYVLSCAPGLPADEIPPGCLHPHYLLRRVIAGIRDYGNRMGHPQTTGLYIFTGIIGPSPLSLPVLMVFYPPPAAKKASRKKATG
ncbi:MAG: hypothetical protein RQM92_08575 [Candidatus Syntrophopropionicum ammoniitolerans]